MDDMDFTREDFSRNRTLAGLGYLVFFIPLIGCRESRLGRWCANQGLLLAIVYVLVSIFFNILGAVPLIGWVFLLVGRLAGLALLIVGLLCAAQVIANERVIQLPFIGFLRLIPDK